MQECDHADKLSKIQGACIAALQAPIESYKTGEALVHQCTYQRHRASHLEKMLQETLSDLARATGGYVKCPWMQYLECNSASSDHVYRRLNQFCLL